MGHHNHNHQNETGKNILIVFFLNLFFVIVEIFGAIISQSVSIASDAFHDLGDCLILLFAYILEKKSKKQGNNTYTFGYKKLSIIASLFTSLILASGSIFMVIRAIERIQNPQPVNGNIMLILSVIAIAINSLGVIKLMGNKKLVSKAIMLHLLEDVFGWVAILISSLFIIKFNWYIIDPILSICISLFILYNASKNIYLSTTLLLDKVPENIDYTTIETLIKNQKEIKTIKNLHIWSLDEETTNLTVTCKISEHLTIKEANNIREKILNQLETYHLNEIIIEFN
jgi:cobalt-zinc-cadmium efflux system protein